VTFCANRSRAPWSNPDGARFIADSNNEIVTPDDDLRTDAYDG
jgi:hypothetical protein